jgi:O-antigen/teichoic acid export membrane protein
MSLGVVSCNLLAFVSELGMGAALIQRSNLSEDDVHAAFWLMLGMNVGIFAAAWFAAPAIAAFYNAAPLAAVIRVLALNLVVSTLRMMPHSLLTRKLAFEQIAIAEFVSSVSGSLLIVALAYRGAGVWSLVSGAVVQNVLSTLWLLRIGRWRPRFTLTSRNIRSMFSFGLTVNATKLLGYLTENADNLVVGRLLGRHDLGLYNMAYITGTLPTQKVGPIVYQVAFPVFSRLQADKRALGAYFLTASRYIASIALPVLIGLALTADLFVPLVLGQKWAPMVGALRALCVVGTLKAIGMIHYSLLTARAVTRPVFWLNVANAVILPALFIIGCRFGITGVGLAWLVASPLMFCAMTGLVLRELTLPVRVYGKALLPAAFSATVMVAGVAVARASSGLKGPFGLALAVGVGAVSYTLSLAASDRSLASDVLALIPRRAQAAVDSKGV